MVVSLEEFSSLNLHRESWEVSLGHILMVEEALGRNRDVPKTTEWMKILQGFFH